jgi:hypothetical protein
MERRPIILSLINRGTPEFQRFAISDQFLRYFDGEGWTPDEHAAVLFSDANLACQEMQRLLMLDYMDKPVRRFRAPVYIDLYASNEVTLDQLAAWLLRTAKLLIDSPRWGNGPCEGTLGLTRINWNELEEIKL